MIDTIIVGAGPSGLCAAKTILECDPNADLIILDAGTTIGGVWAKEKMYPTLKTNHLFGGMDFSDFKMPVAHGAQPGDHIPGTAVHEFLNAYARHFRLVDKIQFNKRVVEAARTSNGLWRLKIISAQEDTIECRKLIIGMGVNNRPHRPDFHGNSDFNAPIIHSSELGTHFDTMIKSPSTTTVAILGGGKSAYDAVHMASVAGKQVEWIMRKTGKGPVWVFPMMAKMGPVEVQRDRLPVRRFISFLSPCIWDDGFKWIRNFFHSTLIGAFITRLFWTKLHVASIKDCGYRNQPQTALLEPEQSPALYGTTGGSCRYLPDLFQRVATGQIHVHREDITHLSDHSIHLADGRILHVDAMITATGFSTKPTINFGPSLSHSDLGIPTTELDLDQQKFWAGLDLQSDIEISRQFPKLVAADHHDPGAINIAQSHTAKQPELSPYRLYRSLAPPGLTAEGDRSLVFLGVFSNFANHARLEIQCLWAYAYLNNKLAIDSKSVFAEASMLSRYSRHRTPYGHGHFFPDHVFDQLPYFDILLRDLNLPTLRKSNWIRELFEPYHVTDYQGIAQEWLAKEHA